MNFKSLFCMGKVRNSGFINFSLHAGSVAAAENLGWSDLFEDISEFMLSVISSKRSLHHLSFQLRQHSRQVVRRLTLSSHKTKPNLWIEAKKIVAFHYSCYSSLGVLLSDRIYQKHITGSDMLNYSGLGIKWPTFFCHPVSVLISNSHYSVK